MLNLLFISDSPKVEIIKSDLQPLLKVIIDVVTDFDHGLKDVFEKRPATVCIQDQIGGVTGESVARHIQMLLGNSAPTFILLHTGNSKAKIIKGLYEYIIDLSLPTEALLENIMSTLKSLLGNQWEKVFIPPKLPPATGKTIESVPEATLEDDDKTVNDLMSDIEVSAPDSTHDNSPFSNQTLDEIIADSRPETKNTGQETHSVKTAKKSPSAVVQSNSDELTGLLQAEPNHVAIKTDKIDRPPIITVPPKEPEQPVPTPAANRASQFQINKKTVTEDEPLPADLLLAFEENYRSESSLQKRYLVIAIVIILGAGAWYLAMHNKMLMSSLKQRFWASSGPKQSQVVPPVTAPVQQEAKVAAPQQAVVKSLPTFVPEAGLDRAYAAKNPGWERYAGKDAEFRLFTASGRIQAVQVLALKGAAVSKELISSVLTEFTGNPGYSVTSRSVKSGVNIENGKASKGGDVLIYKKNGHIKAFVVSVN